MNITIMDTSICSTNVGDYIIMDSVRHELNELFVMHQKITVPTQEKIHYTSYQRIKEAEYAFVGGTNLLSSNMNKYNQWKINLKDTLFLKDVIFMGVGWWQYQEKPNIYTKYLLNKVLNRTIMHSVRDSYTEKQLKSIGISNVLNTACPTMWTLTEEHCNLIPSKKADAVVFTLTDYSVNRELDQALIDILIKNYETVYFWVQGSGDYEYLNSLDKVEYIKIIAPNLTSYDEILTSNQELDYVGTRLHAGIRALQKKRRSLIVAIDNRAIEKSKDVNLQILNREDIKVKLELLINSEFHTEIKIPLENIKLWKEQFHTS